MTAREMLDWIEEALESRTLWTDEALRARVQTALPRVLDALTLPEPDLVRRATHALYRLHYHVDSIRPLGSYVANDIVLVAISEAVIRFEGQGGAGECMAPLVSPLIVQLGAADRPLDGGSRRAVVRRIFRQFPSKILTPVIPLAVHQFVTAGNLSETQETLDLLLSAIGSPSQLPTDLYTSYVSRLTELLYCPNADGFLDMTLIALSHIEPHGASVLPAVEKCISRQTEPHNLPYFGNALKAMATPAALDRLRVLMFDYLRAVRENPDPDGRSPPYLSDALDGLANAGEAGRSALRELCADTPDRAQGHAEPGAAPDAGPEAAAAGELSR